MSSFSFQFVYFAKMLEPAQIFLFMQQQNKVHPIEISQVSAYKGQRQCND